MMTARTTHEMERDNLRTCLVPSVPIKFLLAYFPRIRSTRANIDHSEVLLAQEGIDLTTFTPYPSTGTK